MPFLSLCCVTADGIFSAKENLGTRYSSESTVNDSPCLPSKVLTQSKYPNKVYTQLPIGL
jgi:hypothetical protein